MSNKVPIKIQRLIAATDLCLEEIKKAVEDPNPFNLFSTLYTVKGILDICDLFGYGEVRRDVDNHELSLQFEKLCELEAAKIDEAESRGVAR